MITDYEIYVGPIPVEDDASCEVKVRRIKTLEQIVILAPTREEALRQAYEWIKERRAPAH